MAIIEVETVGDLLRRSVFKVIEADSEPKTVEVRLGAPVACPNSGRWFCAYHVVGLDSSRPKTIQAPDASEALRRAIRAVSAEAQAIGRFTGTVFPKPTWSDGLEFEQIAGLEDFMDALDGTDQELAFRLGLPLAETDIPFAQNSVGCAYLYGQGVAADTQRGLYWLTKGAENCDPGACHNLAVMRSTDWPGIPKDENAARYFFQKAKDFGAFWNICS
jgi:TPR repeat protein